MKRSLQIVLAALLVGASCSSGTADDGSGDPADIAQGLVLRTSAVTLDPGEERYFCWSVAVPDGEPFALSRVDFDLPDGIHHYQLQVQSEVPAEQPFECGLPDGGGPPGGDPSAGGGDGPPMGGAPGGFPTMLALGGPGTAPTMQFPTATAAMLAPGAHVVLQLHLLNTSSDPREIRPAAASLTATEADADLLPIGVLLVNDGQVDIPAGGRDVEAGYDCVLPAPLENVFTVWPHMHLLGKHIEVSIAGSSVVDTAWSFEDQRLYDADQSAAAGDSVSVRCRYDNPGDEPVRFGMSTRDEMCSAFVYYYPAIEDLGICENE